MNTTKSAFEDDRTYWERHAKGYDVSLRFLTKKLPRLRELAVEALHGTRRVLEVAAGTGAVTTAIATAAREVVATDYSEAMVVALEAQVRNSGFSNVRCERADIYALSYEPESFDAVVAANVLHLVPDLDGAITALRRVLVPGGKVIVPTFCHDETLTSAIVSRVIAVTGFPGHRRFTVGSLRQALEDRGLGIRREETLGGLIPIGYVEGVFERTN
jgi:phosphatidylethanolamine/phosphatidyl-N-methylethanolamine N-methyltransferase